MYQKYSLYKPLEHAFQLPLDSQFPAPKYKFFFNSVIKVNKLYKVNSEQSSPTH